jgi:hypothetical protein
MINRFSFYLANNGIGDEAIEVVKLLIKSKPKIVLNMTTVNVAAEDTESVRMVCTAKGVPKVHFKWISPDSEFFISESEKLVNNNVKYFRYNLDRKQIDDTLFQSVLTIKRISNNDLNKSFKCLASNEKGESEIIVKLRSRGRPDPPVLLKVVNITHNSAFLSWVPNFDGGLRQSFKVKYYKTGTNNFESEETDQNWIALNGLESASEYIFTVLAFNGFGESDWDESNNSIRASTYATEFDSSEALIDSLNRAKSNSEKKSVSKIIMIIVFVLGLFLIILNACLVICYFKWKRKIDNGNKQTTKKVKAYKDTINGEAILMKALSEEDVALTTALMPDQSTHTANAKHCEVLMMSDLNSSSSSSLQQPVTHVTHVLLNKSEKPEFSYKRKSLSLETQNCPDIIKNRNIEVSSLSLSHFFFLVFIKILSLHYHLS